MEKQGPKAPICWGIHLSEPGIFSWSLERWAFWIRALRCTSCALTHLAADKCFIWNWHRRFGGLQSFKKLRKNIPGTHMIRLIFEDKTTPKKQRTKWVPAIHRLYLPLRCILRCLEKKKWTKNIPTKWWFFHGDFHPMGPSNPQKTHIQGMQKLPSQGTSWELIRKFAA